MAKILVFLDERSFFFTELAGKPALLARSINTGRLPDGLLIPGEHRHTGSLVAFHHEDLVVVFWKGRSAMNMEDAGGTPPASGLPEVPLPNLTMRENQVLQLLAEGLTSKQIAERLRLSTRTVRYYIEHLNMKFEVQSAEQSVGKGVMLGLCRLPQRPPGLEPPDV
ncbi:MAG TPA: helix-turn-helix transcriptional regulator [Anaerolineaceae bacterium]